MDIELAASSLPKPRLSTRQTAAEYRPYFTHGIAEVVSSVAFLTATPRTLIIGAAHKYTRVIDMRVTPASAGAQQVSNKHHFGLCVDPFDDNRFASHGEDGAIRVWDRRHLGKGPLLTFSEADAGTLGGRSNPLATIAFSPTRRGIFGSLGTDDSPVRMWSIIGGQFLEEQPRTPMAEPIRRSNSITKISPRLPPAFDKGYLPPMLVQCQGSEYIIDQDLISIIY